MMDYEIGAIPSRPMTIFVRDERDNPVNTIGYTQVTLEMLGTDNEKVDLTGTQIMAIPDAIGAYSITWPRDRSIFDKTGKYVLRFVLEDEYGAKDITRTAEITVRKFGRIN